MPAPSLRGTFAKAYSLLTRLVAKIGWDELLKCRSSVFVMEEEYRMQKAAEEERRNQKTTTNISQPQPKESKKDVEVENPKTNGVNDSSQSIPTIAVSEDEQNKTGSENSTESQQHTTPLETINEGSETNTEETNGRQEEGQEEKSNVNQKENHTAPVDEQSLDSDTLEEVNLDDDKSGRKDDSTPPPQGNQDKDKVIEFKGPELEKPSLAANDEKGDNQSIHNDDQNKVL